MRHIDNAVASISGDFFRKIYFAITEAYLTSKQETLSSYHEREAIDLLPYSRRARIETAFYNIGRSFDDLNVERRKNKNRNSTHVEVTSSNLILTQSWTTDQNKVIRPSYFRTSLAEYNQLSLFDDFNSNNADNNVLYGMIVHGAYSSMPDKPDYITLAFPDSNYQYWIWKKPILDLIDIKKAEVEIIEDELVPTWKKTPPSQAANSY
jgi:hypothetical protein